MTSHVLATPRVERWRFSEALLILAVWGLVAAFLMVQYLPVLIANGPTDPTSQLRLVEVREVMAGQAWSNLHQIRIPEADGVFSQGSGLVDFPIAALIRVGNAFASPQTAELFAITAWPLMLFLVLLLAITSVTRRIVGPDAQFSAVAFAIFAAPATTLFLPGHIADDNAAITLFAVLLALGVRIEQGEVIGVLAGVAAACLLAVSIDTLPLVAMTAAGFALTWAFAPKGSRAGLNGFGLFFATGMITQRGFSAAPSEWLATTCTIASAPYVVAAAITGFGLSAIARINPTSVSLRLGAVAIIGVAAVAGMVLVNPQCLGAPSTEFNTPALPVWLDASGSSQSLAQLAEKAPWQLLALYFAPFLALIPTSWAFAMSARTERAGWGLTLILLMTSLVVAMWQTRGAAAASLLIVPALAYAVSEVRNWAARRSRLAMTLALALVYTVPNQALNAIAATTLERLFPVNQRGSVPEPAVTGSVRSSGAEPFDLSSLRGTLDH